ncbi:hypothetical protein [Deinococcus humi]|uniref:Uncharacterized protein n=1 Tax=Deinococcus humi TaxID=662880 RepID=A0A7W8JSU3_9DEIO|nr:hypothetical protein [Deinococcus humi]MBB5362615.1 hypothetical protein [Deinococcus humi]GGO31370.1 hypothetical protein GCM10008949_27310 [Deinococcus humi]
MFPNSDSVALTPARHAARALLLLGASGLGALTLSAPASAQTAAPKPAATSAATTQAASAVAIEISAAIKGQIVSCPSSLKLSPRAVCLYTQTGAASLRPLIAGKLSGRAVGTWKTTGKASTLLVRERANGPLGAFVLLSALNDKESLVVVDAAQAKAAPAAGKPTTPAGVIKGQPYVLGRDLAGVVNVTSQGGGSYRLTTEDGSVLTATVGRKSAQTASGTVELPLAPATDGTNLIFPLDGLRSLGCTVTPAGKSLTVACGADSIGLKPIVF